MVKAMNAPDLSALRLPPHSVEAEQYVIGGLLIDPNAWDRICDLLTADVFYRDDHRRIFGHVQKLREAGKVADILTVWTSIELSNEQEQVGGLAYLGEVANNTPSAANIRWYAEIILDKALRRKLVTTGDEIAQLGFGAVEDARTAIDQAQSMLQSLAEAGVSMGEPVGIGKALGIAIDRIQANYERGIPAGISSGFTDIDAMLHGFGEGDLVIVAGRPSMGKTTFAMNIAENISFADKHAMVFSLEMSKEALATRSLSAVSGIDHDRLMAGKLNDDDWDKMTVGLGKLHNAAMTIDDTGGLTVAQMLSRCRKIARKQKIDIVVIDYLQLIKPPYSKTASNRNDEVSAISAELKAMAKELRCPVIALSQLSRKVEERADKRPLMSDLRDSGALEQDADVIILMYRDDYYKPDSPFKGMAEANIGKHRNGKTGSVNLIFQGEFCRFKNCDHDALRDAQQKAHEARPMKRNRGME